MSDEGQCEMSGCPDPATTEDGFCEEHQEGFEMFLEQAGVDV